MSQEDSTAFVSVGRTPAMLLGWVVILIIFFGLFMVGKRTLIEEVRSHAMGVAIALSEGLDLHDLSQVTDLDDMGTDAFVRIQNFLQRMTEANPDIRYIYTMRRSLKPGAAPTDYEYIVDGPESDDNNNGVIDADEVSEDSGTRYDASPYPEMVLAWEVPGADRQVTPDPPYPDLLSGYAPIKDKDGTTIAIVGVDVIAPTIRAKLRSLKLGVMSAGLLLGVLVSAVVTMNWKQKVALRMNRRLTAQLTDSNEHLQAVNKELGRRNEQFREELKLAQTVQLGFLPSSFPRQDRVHFDKYYRTCEIVGGDLFDVFEIDEKHVGLYVADVSGHGVSAALISGLLKMAMTSVRDTGSGHGVNPVLLNPSRLLRYLHDVIEKDIPDYDYITMLYGVLDVDSNMLRMANAGHLFPVCYMAVTDEVQSWEIPSGGAIGLLPDPTFETSERQFAKEDTLVLYTDGLTEAMNSAAEEFGHERFLAALSTTSGSGPCDIVQGMRAAVDEHLGEVEANDDFTLLVAQVR